MDVIAQPSLGAGSIEQTHGVHFFLGPQTLTAADILKPLPQARLGLVEAVQNTEGSGMGPGGLQFQERSVLGTGTERGSMSAPELIPFTHGEVEGPVTWAPILGELGLTASLALVISSSWSFHKGVLRTTQQSQPAPHPTCWPGIKAGEGLCRKDAGLLPLPSRPTPNQQTFTLAPSVGHC